MLVTMAGFFPPISMMSGRGTGRAALSRISFRPTSFDPVNTMPSMPSLSISSWPTVEPGPVTKLKTPGGSPASTTMLVELRAEERRVAGGLEDDGVPGRQRATGRAGRERDRKIERRNDGPDAVRPQHADVLFAGAQRSHLLDEAFVLLDLIAVVRHQIGAFFDVADAFESVLADLVAHQRRQLVAVIANRVGDLSHVRRAAAATAEPPTSGYARPRRGDRRLHMFPRALLKSSEQDARVDGAAIVELLSEL